ncbi:curli production assembly/transport component CsgF [Ascidiimonas sp. W6]|uniref:curli production assembly/transport component CsgF n=1 Tax=Ascidiimonas meishanensis TaxID=3128903 RepID=UPI0030ECA3A1
MKYSILFLLTFFVTLEAFSQQMVYRPKNPAFGGDTFNYNWLLSSAEAQNTFTEDVGSQSNSEIDEFTNNLNRQLLNQLSRNLFSEQFGDQGLEEGTFTFGSLFLEIFPTNEGLTIDILDTNTGEKTQVIIPN